MDAIHYKVTDERGYALTRAIYNVLEIDAEGHKVLLGIYVSKNASANFWQWSVLTYLQNWSTGYLYRLKGFPDAIRNVYSNKIVPLYIRHQTRNSIKYVGSKHQKEFMKDLKLVYQAVSKETAETELQNLNFK